MRSADPFTQLVEFSTGFPDGNVTWVLRDGDGTQLATAAITPPVGSTSVNINVSGANNTLAGGVLYDYRDLSWSYLTGGSLVSGSVRYRVDSFLKFGVTEDGVRHKLGLEKHEVTNDVVDLLSAYAIFETTVTAATLATVTDAKVKLLVRDAIEALAGLRLLPSLQVKLARKEASGVSEFTRAPINWEQLKADLNELLAAGYQAVDPALDPATQYGSIFNVVVRSPDVITGA